MAYSYIMRKYVMHIMYGVVYNVGLRGVTSNSRCSADEPVECYWKRGKPLGLFLQELAGKVEAPLLCHSLCLGKRQGSEDER